MKFVIAGDADLAALTKAAQTAITELSTDAESQGYIEQIQARKDAAAGAARPAAASARRAASPA